MNAVTVTQVNTYISNRLITDINLKNIAVEGEISGFRGGGRHLYFDLIDEGSKIRCAIWYSMRERIDESLLVNGSKVIVNAKISPYVPGGSYSLSVTKVKDAGAGALNAEFERLKKLMYEKGFFDDKYKKPIPLLPRTIGVITSAHGAAVEDIKKTVVQKNDYTDILIFNALVQGSGAPESIISAIRTANKISAEGRPHIDTLIVGRGGGSAEDLSCFNDEGVAMAIFESRIPVISAVGHENDYTISDFVADARAKTPTAAADMAVADTLDIRNEIIRFRNVIFENIIKKIDMERNLLKSQIDILNSNVMRKADNARAAIEKAEVYLRENNPRNILSKGYAIVKDECGAVAYDIDMINEGDIYKVILQNGSFKVEVTEKREGESI